MWLMEQPYVVLMGGLVLTVMFAAGFLKTGKRVLIFAVIGSVLATLGLFLLERTTITPREEVRATLHIIAHELEQNNVDGVLEHISNGRPEIKTDAAQKMAMVTVSEVDIKRNLKINLVSAKGMEIAEARFNCVIQVEEVKGFSDFMDASQRVPRFFIVRFRQDDDGRWRVRDYEMKDPRQGLGT